jgi:hypothetical protein
MNKIRKNLPKVIYSYVDEKTGDIVNVYKSYKPRPNETWKMTAKSQPRNFIGIKGI